MNRAFAYAIAVFAIVAAYLVSGLLTQSIMGAVAWADFPTFLGVCFGSSALLAAITYALIAQIGKRFSSKKPNDRPYRSNQVFVVVVLALAAGAGAYGMAIGYPKGKEAQQAALKQKQMADQRAQAVEAEKLRMAALTPEQRAEEDRIRKEEVAAAQKVAADAEKQRQAAEEKIQADKDKRDKQLQQAAGGAALLKRAMKDPEAFELRSLLVMPNGTACYEYRAKNGFGAVFPGSAVFTAAGQMLVQEQHGNDFVRVWNKDSTKTGGQEISALVKRLGII